MRVLVTGGTGYIGSHTCVELLKAGVEVVILDNLYNSKGQVVRRIANLSGKAPSFVDGDVRDRALLERLFREQRIDAVLHFAGWKAVAESCRLPLDYYDNNVHGSLALLQAMKRANCKTLVFSSSATVYGSQNPIPYHEEFPLGVATNPYGRTKIIVEGMLRDLAAAEDGWKISILRYFNPVGAHESGLLGEDPNGIPNNLMPVISNVARGKQSILLVFGTDYDTEDGTCERDYIHVMDLAEGHVCALKEAQKRPGCEVFNLGTGQGVSVLSLVKGFEEASGKSIPWEAAARRAGDLPVYYADAQKAKKVLGWEARRGVPEMCRDVWNFLQKQS